MISMNKIKYIFFTLSLLGLFLLYQINENYATDDLSCTGKLRKNTFLADGSELVLDTNFYMLVGKGNEGVANYNGIITNKGKYYKVNRMISFDYSTEKGSSIYRFVWHDMHLTDEDTLPAEFDSMIHSTEKQSYFQLRRLAGNMMTVNKNGFPLFICAIK